MACVKRLDNNFNVLLAKNIIAAYIFNEVIEMNVFRDIRKRRGVSQKELGESVHVSQTSISQWETGKTYPDVNTLVKLADFYGTSTDYLLGRTQNPLSMIPGDTPYVECTPFERSLLESYRKADQVTQSNIALLLGMISPAELRAKANAT